MLSVVVTFALVTAASPFDDAKKGAAVVERLAATVAALVGVCPDGLTIDELSECQQNLGRAAQTWAGKKVYVNLGVIDPAFLGFGSKVADRARLIWAPLFDLGNGLMLTVGKPEKLSERGNVVVARRPFEGACDPELLESDLERALKTGQVGVEVVAVFGKPWQLKGKGLVVSGLSLQLGSVRFFHTRTGKGLVEVIDLK